MQSPLPTECPRCHSPMQAGFTRVMSSLLWSEPPGVLIGTPLTSAPWTIEEFPGFRCPGCRLLVVDYAEFAERKP
jgi:hypothetical protein